MTVALATTGDAPLYLEEIGHTTASQVVNIQSQVAGQIMERRFKDGDLVQQGQVLFVIDQRPFQAKVNQAKANLELAKSQLELAQVDFDRTLQAFKRGAASPEDRDTKQGTLDNAKAQLQVNQADLDTANLNLSYCTITSPITGTAGQRQVDTGNLVKANDTSLVTIQSLAPMYCDFTITERDLPEVRELMNANALDAKVFVPTEPEEIKNGKLTFLDTAVQPGAGRVRLRATLGNQEGYFWPGQYVNVRLVLRVLHDAVLIPNECVQVGQQGPYVYIVQDDDTAVQQPVTTGQREGDQIIIQRGVSAGQRIIQTGQLAVTPGGKVHVIEGAAPSATSPATTATASQPAGDRP